MTQLMGRILYDLGMVKTLQTIRYIRYIYLTVFAGSSTTAVFNFGLLSYHVLSEGVLLSEISQSIV